MAAIDVRSISSKLKQDLKTEVDKILDKGGRAPHLSAIIVGENPASN